jgi:outer membrane biosynthesis protein TonB
MRSSPRHAELALLLLLAGLAASGCHRQTAQAASPAQAAPAESAGPAPASTEEAPSPKKEAEATPTANPGERAPANAAPKPPTLKVPEPAHSAPKPPATAPASQPSPDAPAPRPIPPLISPRVSPAQQTERRQQTEKSISVAETNLRRASGHALNDTQQDMVEKIRSFLAQAREAGEIPDWERALVLAEKARVLSEELVNSL